MKQFSTFHFSLFTSRWNHFWFRTGPPHLLALLRIAFGSYLLFYFGLKLPHVPLLFSNAGLVIPYDIFPFEYLRTAELQNFLTLLLTPPDPAIAYVIFSSLLISLLLFTIGFATKTAASFSFLLFLYYILLSFHHSSTSYNRLFLFLILLFTFSGAGKAFSFEMWRKHGSVLAWEPISILTQRLIAVQITMTYLGVGWQKMWLPDWQSGEVLYYSFRGMWATPVAWWFVSLNLPMKVYDVMVFIVKAFEVALPLGLWSRKLRLWFMAGGVLFHIGVSLFISAIWWFYAMIACYICFFTPEEVHQWLFRHKAKRVEE